MSKASSTIRIDLKRLFFRNTEAGVGGYYLNQSNRSRLPLEICFRSKKMIVQPEDLRRLFRKGDKLFKAKRGGKDYYVYYINWRPDQEDPNQEKLFNENRKTRK